MNKTFILLSLFLSFIISCGLLSVGITFCTKLDFCYRPFDNNQCLGVTTDCPYNNYNQLTRGNCCLNQTYTECQCCQFYNSYTNLVLCILGTMSGIFLFLSSCVYLIGKELYTCKNIKIWNPI